jgi:hypothetical protein
MPKCRSSSRTPHGNGDRIDRTPPQRRPFWPCPPCFARPTHPGVFSTSLLVGSPIPFSNASRARTDLSECRHVDAPSFVHRRSESRHRATRLADGRTAREIGDRIRESRPRSFGRTHAQRAERNLYRGTGDRYRRGSVAVAASSGVAGSGSRRGSATFGVDPSVQNALSSGSCPSRRECVPHPSVGQSPETRSFAARSFTSMVDRSAGRPRRSPLGHRTNSALPSVRRCRRPSRRLSGSRVAPSAIGRGRRTITRTPLPSRRHGGQDLAVGRALDGSPSHNAVAASSTARDRSFAVSRRRVGAAARFGVGS